MIIYIYGGFDGHGGTPKWMVSEGKYHLEVDDDKDTSILGNTHML